MHKMRDMKFSNSRSNYNYFLRAAKMYLLNSVTLRFDFNLKEALWFASLDLKVVAISPT